ncbi:MAG: EF-Tu/IF-2/RF-3 family GTPase [Candidatus Buchananbacteria bacterium]
MEEKIGKITHFFSKIGIAVLEVTTGSIKVGDTIHLVGHGIDFSQVISSMQVDHAPVTEVQAGESAGLKIDQLVKEGVEVFKVS